MSVKQFEIEGFDSNGRARFKAPPEGVDVRVSGVSTHAFTRRCLAARGWTPGMILALLGEHDHRGVANNPRSALYWFATRVELAEKTPEFASLQAKALAKKKTNATKKASSVAAAREILARVEARERRCS